MKSVLAQHIDKYAEEQAVHDHYKEICEQNEILQSQNSELLAWNE